MISKLHLPTPPLNSFISHFYYFSGYSPHNSIDRFLPDGEVQLIIDLTATPKYIYDNDSLEIIQSCTRVWFSGFRTLPITIPSGKASELIVVEFQKGKSYPFLKVPLHELTNLVVDAELVVKAEILTIREQLLEAPTIEEKFSLLEQQLLNFYQNNLSISPVVDFALNSLVQAPQVTNLKALSAKIGYSQKHFIQLFKKHVGVTPKAFLRVWRFQQAIQQIGLQQELDWTTVAYDGGFYDQSHFIANFKQFSGFTPQQYLAQRGDFLNYIPMD